MKKFFKIFFSVLLLLLALFVVDSYPVNSQPKSFDRVSDTVGNVDMLDTVASRIQIEFLRYTPNVSVQPYTVGENIFKNIIASYGPADAPRIIIRAHYDVCRAQDGADDNASGVAGILEIARLLHGKNLDKRIDLVAYSTEEPPYFNTKHMGSYIHAKSLHDSRAPVLGMISLEMIGYYSDEYRSQRYPVNALRWVYGDKGNFITIVQKTFAGKFARQFKREAFKNNSIPTKSFKAPSFFGGINLSDHANYWQFGYSAIMITNTSFYRNHNYHRVTDRIETLDIGRMALTIDGVYRSLLAYQSK